MLKKFFILFVLGILFFTTSSNVNAQNNDIAMNGEELSDININVSDIQNNQYLVNVTQQMVNRGYTPSPDNYYYGNLIITNDTNQAKKFKKIEVAGMVQARSGYDVSDYEKVLNEWFTYSFNVNNGEAIVNDTPINQFTNASFSTNGNQLISDNGYAELNDYIYINPQTSVEMYYDFSYSWETDNRTQNMSFALIYALDFENVVQTYGIETKVVNGTIDQSINNISAGSNQTINYQAKEGYTLESIVVDGKTIDVKNNPTSYVFSNINENHTIEVIYALNKIEDDKDIDDNGDNENISNNENDKKNNENDKKEKSSDSNNLISEISKMPKTGNSFLFEAMIIIISSTSLLVTSKMYKKYLHE